VTAPEWLRGSFVPLVTPFSEGEIDREAFAAAVERQVSGGSSGVVVTGTSGEPTSLTADERTQLFALAVETSAGRLPVVAATGSASHRETLALTRAAERLGADAVLVVCPAFVRPTQQGLVQHFTRVFAGIDIPQLIYNIPGRAGVGVTAETVERIATGSPNLVGLKHAASDLDLVSELLLLLGEDFRVFCGLETYSLPMLAVGGAGLMNAVGNLFPEHVAALCTLVAKGDHSQALRLHRAMFRLNAAIFIETNPGPLKAMLALVGMGSDEVRLPLTAPGPQVRERLAEILRMATGQLAEAMP
jgi:4-hydroxy-tetrahydrodipicolinate synthase